MSFRRCDIRVVEYQSQCHQPGTGQDRIDASDLGERCFGGGIFQPACLGRLGEPEQVASLAEWLLDPENHWITGQVIGIDGGLGHVLPKR